MENDKNDKSPYDPRFMCIGKLGIKYDPNFTPEFGEIMSKLLDPATKFDTKKIYK
jgi:hypothetical protein